MSIKLKRWNSNDELSAKNMNDKVENVENYLNNLNKTIENKDAEVKHYLERINNIMIEQENKSINSEEGVFGLRFFNAKLQYKENEQWVDISLR